MKKYLVYKISGGLNHMLIEINNAIHFSNLTNRTLIIDTRGNAFNSDFNKYFSIPEFEYYTNYDIIESEIKKNYANYLEKFARFKDGLYYLEDKIITLKSDEMISSKEDIIFFSYWKRLSNEEQIKDWKIKVNQNIINEIEQLSTIEGDYIGFHFRNTDMKHDLEELSKQVLYYTENIKTVYFSTDDITSLDKFKKIIPEDIEVLQYTIPQQQPDKDIGKGIHYSNPNKHEVIMNTLIDMYYLKNSKYFVESPKSAFSKRVKAIREGDKFF